MHARPSRAVRRRGDGPIAGRRRSRRQKRPSSWPRRASGPWS